MKKGSVYFLIKLCCLVWPKHNKGASLVAQTVKHLPAMWEIQVLSLGQEDTLEKEMATHSSTLAWKIPWMEEPGRLQFMGLQRVGHDWTTSLHFTGGSDGKESTHNVGDLGLMPGLGRSPGGGHSNPLQYSCLKNPHGQRSLAGYIQYMGLQRVEHNTSPLNEQICKILWCPVVLGKVTFVELWIFCWLKIEGENKGRFFI